MVDAEVINSILVPGGRQIDRILLESWDRILESAIRVNENLCSSANAPAKALSTEYETAKERPILAAPVAICLL